MCSTTELRASRPGGIRTRDPIVWSDNLLSPARAAEALDPPSVLSSMKDATNPGTVGARKRTPRRGGIIGEEGRSQPGDADMDDGWRGPCGPRGIEPLRSDDLIDPNDNHPSAARATAADKRTGLPLPFGPRTGERRDALVVLFHALLRRYGAERVTRTCEQWRGGLTFRVITECRPARADGTACRT